MDINEALRFMGLDAGANDDEVKAAYREMSQILHPDRFENNPKLKERATEQFKQLNEARDALMSRTGSASRKAYSSSYAAAGGSARSGAGAQASALNSRLLAIESARSAIIAYKDSAGDKLRNGMIIMGVALVLGLLVGRRLKFAIPVGIIAFIVGIALSTRAAGDIAEYKKQLEILDRERQECQAQLDALFS